MFIAETFFCFSTVYATSLKRARRENEPFQVWDQSSNCLSWATGTTLEGRLRMEIEEIDGVADALVRRTADSFVVDVTMVDYEFSNYERVVAKELEMVGKYPDHHVTFNIAFSGNDLGRNESSPDAAAA
jgi:hypothetical protein